MEQDIPMEVLRSLETSEAGLNGGYPTIIVVNTEEPLPDSNECTRSLSGHDVVMENAVGVETTVIVENTVGLENAVCVENAVVGYQRGKKILDGVNLKVKNGTCHVVVGPTGSGKSLLFKALSGLCHLESGTVSVLGGSPSNRVKRPYSKFFGAMPQSYALFKECTTMEYLKYFGRLKGLSEEEIEQRIKELAKVFDVKDLDKNVRFYSGGQQRRISFMAALMDNPTLILLDEPLAGFDIVLRRRTWEYLRACSAKHGTTVVMITSDFYESRHADKVSLLHEGKIVLEGVYDTFQVIMKEDSIEDGINAYLKAIDKPRVNTERGEVNLAFVMTESQNEADGAEALAIGELYGHVVSEAETLTIKDESQYDAYEAKTLAIEEPSEHEVEGTETLTMKEGSQPEVDGTETTLTIKEGSQSEVVDGTETLTIIEGSQPEVDGTETLATEELSVHAVDEAETLSINEVSQHEVDGTETLTMKERSQPEIDGTETALTIKEGSQPEADGAKRKLAIIEEESRQEAASALESIQIEEDVPQVNVRNLTRARLAREIALQEKCFGIPSALGRIILLLRLNFSRIFRSWPLVLLMVAVPALEVLSMNACFGQPPNNIPIGIYNGELVENNLTICSYQPKLECDISFLSCNIMQRMDNKSFQLIYYNTKEKLYSDSKLGKFKAYYAFEPKFSSTLVVWNVLGERVGEVVKEQLHIGVGLDAMDLPFASFIEKGMLSAATEFVKEYMDSCNVTNDQYLPPFQISHSIDGHESFTYADDSTTGTILIVLFFFPMITISIMMIRYKKDSTFQRALASGVSHTEFFLAQFITLLLSLMVQSFLTIGILWILIGKDFYGSFFLAFGMCLLVGINGTLTGFLISAICASVMTSIYITVGLLIPSLVISGAVWPVSGLSTWFSVIRVVAPMGLPVDAMHCIITKGLGLTCQTVLIAIGASATWMVVLLALYIGVNWKRVH